MLSWGPRPPNNSQVSSSPHPIEVARVFITIAEISAASAEIIRRDERRNSESCLSTATLDRVSSLSESLWEEVMSLPVPTIPPLHESLKIYKLILVDIQRILSSSGPVEISYYTLAIDRRLDEFLLQFQEALDLLKGHTGQQSSSNSMNFLQNARNIIISGGIFSSISNPVTHDPVVREQSNKILQRVTNNLPKIVDAVMKIINCSCGADSPAEARKASMISSLSIFRFHMEVGCVPA